MQRLLASLRLAAALALPGSVLADDLPKVGWLPALPGYAYVFPRDHAAHPAYKTEWWYFTGNLQDTSGHAYGYELTFFREGVLPPGAAAGEPRSRFVQNDFKFAHFAISDLSNQKFFFTQKTSRGAFGEAGFGQPTDPRLAWLDNWTLQPQADGSWRITAQANPPASMSIDLRVAPAKPPIIEGAEGVSRKAAGLGNASHYYSLTRLETIGTLALGPGGPSQPVHGLSWFDHEWASNQLAADQIGWNWFCCQFDDRTELMLYAMRKRDGTIDQVSSGTLIDAHGATTYLTRADINFRSLRSWHSRRTNATYPLVWQVSIPSRQLELKIEPRLDDQELALTELTYWEGATTIAATRAGHPLTGLGYMELTGYAGPLKGL